MSDSQLQSLRVLPRFARLGTAFLLLSAAVLSGACGGVDDGRSCCRGVLCGYPPDKNGECVGPSSETTSFLDSDGGTGWEDDDAATKADEPEPTTAVVDRAAPVVLRPAIDNAR